MVLRKRESRSPPSYFQVEALPARLLGGLFVSLYRVNAALFPRAVVLFRNHPKPTVLYVPQYVANFVSKKSCSI